MSRDVSTKLPFKKKRNEEKKKKAYELLERQNKGSSVSPIIIKEREVTTEVMVGCTYCGALMKVTSTHCPTCGAPRRK